MFVYKQFHNVHGYGIRITEQSRCKLPNSLDLLFGLAGEEASLHYDWLLGESSLAKNLEKSCPRAINNRCLGSLSSILHPGLFRDKGPQLVNVDAWLVQVGVVG